MSSPDESPNPRGGPAAPGHAAPAARRSALRDHALVLAVAIAVRALTLAAASELPSFTLPDVDARIYHEEALGILRGEPGGPVRMLLGAGYFYLLAAFYALFGPGPIGFRLAQHALGLLAVSATFETARRLLPRRSAWLAGLLLATSGPLAFFETAQLSDAPAAALTALVMFGVVQRGAAARPDVGRADDTIVALAGSRRLLLQALALGLLAGGAAALRPNLLALLLPVVFVLGVDTPERARRGSTESTAPGASRRTRAHHVGAALLGAALALGPIAARNRLVAHEPVLLTANGGLNLFLGNGPGATGSFRVPAELTDARGPRQQFAAFHRAAERAEGRRLSVHEADLHWRRRALAEVVRDPARSVRLLARKARLLVNGHEIWDVYHLGFLRQRDPRLGLLPDARLLMPVGLFGALVVLARRGPRGARLVLLVAVAVGLPLVLVFVSARYRLALLPPFAVLGAIGLETVVRTAGQAGRRGPKLALAVGLALAVFACLPLRSKRSGFAEESFKLGAGYHTLRRLPEAEAAYRACLREAPSHLPARANLALVLTRQGRTAEARASWAEVAERAEAAGDPALAARARGMVERLAARP